MAAYATRLQTYTRLAADNSAVITSSFENWTQFLATASRLYKYTFLEQLMIHIQRPQATACAEYSIWSDQMRRYVRRNARGIAVIRFIDNKPTVRYVFDVADTGPKENALYPFLWENKDEYRAVIPAALEGRFQVPCDHRGLPIQLAAIAAQLAEKYWTNGQEQITRCTGDCLPGDLAETFQDAVAASATYALLARCSLHPERFFDAEDFASVYRFNTFRPVLALGTAVSKCSGLVLRTVETAVKQYERNKKANRPIPSSAAPPSVSQGADRRLIEDAPEVAEVPDVQTPGTSFIPPQEEEDQLPQPEASGLPLALRPTAPPAAGNFHITDDYLGVGGPKARFRANVTAIAVLNTIEADGRTATQEEQEVLSRYVGWGGLPEAFDPNKPDWAAEYQELKNLLSEPEYASAMSSTLNAHYTSPVIIRAIYAAVQAMGFKTGNILDIKTLDLIQSLRTITGKIL